MKGRFLRKLKFTYIWILNLIIGATGRILIDAKIKTPSLNTMSSFRMKAPESISTTV
jgi:hypothetical protein